MSIGTKFVLHGIVSGASTISQIENCRVNPGANIMLGTPAGLPFPLNAFNTRIVPEITFDTGQLITLVGLGGTNGVHYIDLSAANVDLHFKATTNLSTRTADASLAHQRYRAAMAALGIDRITAGDQTPAKASCRIVCIYNGSAVPLVAAGSLALAGTPTFAEQYLAGPCSITYAGPTTTTISGVQDFTLDFGRKIVTAGGDGELYATHSFQETIEPVITIRAPDMGLPTIGVGGILLTAFTCYLRRSGEVGPVANATASHFKISGTTAIVTVDDANGGNNDGGMTTYRITPVGANSTTNPITITPSSAIT